MFVCPTWFAQSGGAAALAARHGGNEDPVTQRLPDLADERFVDVGAVGLGSVGAARHWSRV